MRATFWSSNAFFGLLNFGSFSLDRFGFVNGEQASKCKAALVTNSAFIRMLRLLQVRERGSDSEPLVLQISLSFDNLALYLQKRLQVQPV